MEGSEVYGMMGVGGKGAGLLLVSLRDDLAMLYVFLPKNLDTLVQVTSSSCPALMIISKSLLNYNITHFDSLMHAPQHLLPECLKPPEAPL